MQKIKRDLNGSFTVEAALLMTVLIPLLTALIYLGFYQHDKVWIANKTRTEAMEAALDTDRKNQTDWSGVLACGNVSGGVKRGKNKGNVQNSGICGTLLYGRANGNKQ